MGRWYKLKLSLDTNDTFLVTADAFPEVTTFGEDQVEALKNGLLAIEEAIAARIADSEDIPHPLDKTSGRGRYVELPLMAYLKAALYMIMRSKGVNRAELCRRLGVHREQVDRLFRLDHNSRLDQIEAAFEALGVPIEVAVPFPKAA